MTPLPLTAQLKESEDRRDELFKYQNDAMDVISALRAQRKKLVGALEHAKIHFAMFGGAPQDLIDSIDVALHKAKDTQA